MASLYMPYDSSIVYHAIEKQKRFVLVFTISLAIIMPSNHMPAESSIICLTLKKQKIQNRDSERKTLSCVREACNSSETTTRKVNGPSSRHTASNMST
jgi:hypothetical protein